MCSVLLTAGLAAASFLGCAGNPTSNPSEQGSLSSDTSITTPTRGPLLLDQPAPENLKILVIGNSNCASACTYLCQVASDLGAKNFTVGLLWRGDSTLQIHMDFAKSGEPGFLYNKTTTGSFPDTTIKPFSAGLLDDTWDIVVLQQGSDDAGTPSSYDGLPELIEMVRQAQPQARFMYHMVWPYAEYTTHPPFQSQYGGSQMTMYRQIVDATKEKVLPNKDISTIIPGGTMIQSLRSASYGDGFQVEDGVHLNTYGCYAAAVLWYAALTCSPVESLTWKPAGITAKFRDQVKELVPKVLASPYDIVDCSAF